MVAGAEGWVDMSTRAARPCRPADVALFAELGAQDSSLLQQELGLDLGRQHLPGPRVNPTRDFQAGAIYKAEVSLPQDGTVHLQPAPQALHPSVQSPCSEAGVCGATSVVPAT